MIVVERDPLPGLGQFDPAAYAAAFKGQKPAAKASGTGGPRPMDIQATARAVQSKLLAYEKIPDPPQPPKPTGSHHQIAGAYQSYAKARQAWEEKWGDKWREKEAVYSKYRPEPPKKPARAPGRKTARGRRAQTPQEKETFRRLEEYGRMVDQQAAEAGVELPGPRPSGAVVRDRDTGRVVEPDPTTGTIVIQQPEGWGPPPGPGPDITVYGGAGGRGSAAGPGGVPGPAGAPEPPTSNLKYYLIAGAAVGGVLLMLKATEKKSA